MNYRDALLAYRDSGRALLAANFYNAETLLAILRAARQTTGEIVLQASPSTLSYLGIDLAAAMARAAAREVGVTAWLHLDHATDRGLVQLCLDAGFDSVMIDASEKDLEANIDVTRLVVGAARRAGAAVEAELGYVPKLGQSDAGAADMTSPADARRFVQETRVDALAVAIGNAHGFYRREPHLDLELLEAIRRAADVPLVLHGGSGLTAAQWQASIMRGIAKVNFATEIKDTFMAAARTGLCAGDDIDLRRVFPPAMQAVTDLVAAKIRVCAMEEA